MKLLSVIALLIFASAARAATINAASASQADVAAAVTAATSGDTVAVPAGTVTWTAGVGTGAKVIHFVGAGEGVTNITNTTSSYIFTLTTDGSSVSGFTMSTLQNCITVYANDTVIKDCTMTLASGPTLKKAVYYDGRNYAGGWYKGLIHNCTITGLHCHTQGNGIATGAGFTTVPGTTWYTKPLGLGTDDAMYVEDCTFTMSVQGNVVDAEYGGAYVFRYNTVTVNSGISGSPIECHGILGGGERAARKWEIYENTVTGLGSNFRPVLMRGGTGVMFNNKFFGSGWSFSNAEGGVDQAGRLHPLQGAGDNGGEPYDGNNASQSGTHDGSNNAATLTDSTKSWTTNQYVRYMVYNLTDGSRGRITANTGTTATVTLTGGTDNDFDAGDSYKITAGYPLRDQVGMGTDDSLATGGNPYPTQTRDPAYVWSNIYDADGVLPAGQATWNVALVGWYTTDNTDIFRNVGAKPGYSAYTYPHPLRGVEASVRNPGRRAKAGRVLTR